MTATTTPQDLASKFAALKAPFGSHEIEWKMGKTNQEKTRGRPLPYLKFRAVADRLDEVFGETNWLATYVAGPAGGVVCRLSLRIGDEWLCKENGAGNTETEGIKGGLTDAFKRAATMWGVGRYLHTYEAIAVDIDPQTGRWAIPALPDDCLPAAEVEQRRKDAEAAEAAIQAATEAAAAAGERAPAVVASPVVAASADEPLSTTSDAGTATVAVPDSTASAAAQPQSTDSAEEPAAADTVTPPATATDAGAPADNEPVAVTAVAQEAKVEATPEQKPEVVQESKPEAKPESKAKAAAAAKAAEKAEAAKAAAAAAAQSAEQTPPAAGAGVEDEVVEDKELTFDPTTGAPVLPKGMTPKHECQVLALISRIGKPEVKLSTIREYVTGAGAATVSDIGRQYVLACLDHEQKRLDALAAAPAA